MKKVLLTVRMPREFAREIALNQAVREIFDIVYCNVDPDDESRPGEPFAAQTAHLADDIETELPKLIERHRVTHALLVQPLLPYSTAADRILQAAGVKRVWFEAAFGGFCVWDNFGCQYTIDNEIVRYSGRIGYRTPLIPFGDKFDQPAAVPPATIHARYFAGPERGVVLFSQVEHDMSLAETSGRMPYVEWARRLVEANPDFVFLVKEHPLFRFHNNYPSIFARLEGLDNVARYEEAVSSSLRAYRLVAAYSSTVILEAALRKVPVITGGYHFLDHGSLCLRVARPEEAVGAPHRIDAMQLDELALQSRLGFLTSLYLMKCDDARVADKILLPAEEWYGRHGGL